MSNLSYVPFNPFTSQESKARRLMDDQIKKLEAWLVAEGIKFGWVHDEIVIDAPPDRVDDVLAKLKEAS